MKLQNRSLFSTFLFCATTILFWVNSLFSLNIKEIETRLSQDILDTSTLSELKKIIKNNRSLEKQQLMNILLKKASLDSLNKIFNAHFEQQKKDKILDDFYLAFYELVSKKITNYDQESQNDNHLNTLICSKWGEKFIIAEEELNPLVLFSMLPVLKSCMDDTLLISFFASYPIKKNELISLIKKANKKTSCDNKEKETLSLYKKILLSIITRTPSAEKNIDKWLLPLSKFIKKCRNTQESNPDKYNIRDENGQFQSPLYGLMYFIEKMPTGIDAPLNLKEKVIAEYKSYNTQFHSNNFKKNENIQDPCNTNLSLMNVNIPVRNQNDLGGVCYIYSASDMINYYNKKNIIDPKAMSVFTLNKSFGQPKKFNLFEKIRSFFFGQKLIYTESFYNHGGITSSFVEFLRKNKTKCEIKKDAGPFVDLYFLNILKKATHRTLLTRNTFLNKCAKESLLPESFLHFVKSANNTLKSFNSHSFDDIIKKLYLECSNLPQDVLIPELSSYNKKDVIDKNILNTETQFPLEVTYDTHTLFSKIKNYTSSKQNEYHSSLIIARRINKKTGKCQVYLKNTWGERWPKSFVTDHQNNSDLGNGGYWVDTDILNQSLNTITVIK